MRPKLVQPDAESKGSITFSQCHTACRWLYQTNELHFAVICSFRLTFNIDKALVAFNGKEMQMFRKSKVEKGEYFFTKLHMNIPLKVMDSWRSATDFNIIQLHFIFSRCAQIIYALQKKGCISMCVYVFVPLSQTWFLTTSVVISAAFLTRCFRDSSS